ncbi:hypothetical protein AGLY_015810 [Aphis glycines]|uniref:Endonuclease/exonuclease/phosphatase domain-containing protein n=1 Tax=Aphis glycines TaxID=307491 RepID=A0A6G0SZC6_APHGL|nr:hypothetical protein AGLY_015810 [Aphis glycines]
MNIRQLPATQADLIMAGDFNAHSAEWGSGTIDTRGTLLADFALALGLVVCNVGSKPTYRRVNAASVIDVTLARPLPGNYPLVEDWDALEEVYSASDHLYIKFTVATPDVHPRSLARDRISGWSVKKLKLEKAHAYWDLVGVPQSRMIAEARAVDVTLMKRDIKVEILERCKPSGCRPLMWHGQDV